jgi:hypothetical protein
MTSDVCACCGTSAGEVQGDLIARVSPVQIASKFVVRPGEPREVSLCNRCVARMPFNMSELIADVDMQSDQRCSDDIILEGFIRRYIVHVWPEDSPPSVQQLCRLLNAVGLYTPRGVRWEYHNLSQRLARLDIDRDKLLLERSKATYSERLASLIRTAAMWTLDEVSENGPIVTDPDAYMRPEPVDDGRAEWPANGRQEPLEEPEGMPGLAARL